MATLISEVITNSTITLNVATSVYERIFNAFQADTQHVSKQPIDFNQWAVNCLLDWAEAVEIESARNG